MRKIIAVIMFVMLAAEIPVAFAQDTQVPAYATPFDLEQTVGDLTVRMLWASADDRSIQIAWETETTQIYGSWSWNVEIRHAGKTLGTAQTFLAAGFPTPETMTSYYVSTLEPSGLQSIDSAALELVFQPTDNNEGMMFVGGQGGASATATPRAPVLPFHFILELPVYAARRWDGEQAVTANGVSMTLLAVEYLPSATRLSLCYPRMSVKFWAMDMEYDPYVNDPVYRAEIIAIIEGQPVVMPEATDEFGRQATPIPTPEKCVVIILRGWPLGSDGVLHVTFDELRTRIMPTPENTALLNVALENAGSTWRAHYDQSNGFGLMSGGQAMMTGAMLETNIAWDIASDVMSERILGTWTFVVPLSE